MAIDADARISSRRAPDTHLSLADLHPRIREAAERDWIAGRHPEAVRRAYDALRDLVRQRLASTLDGAALMEAIGDGGRPNLALTSMADDAAVSTHRGLWRFLVGLVHYVRDPDAHGSAEAAEPDVVAAFELLCLISLCTRHVEGARRLISLDEAVHEVTEPGFAGSAEAVADLVAAVPRRDHPQLVRRLLQVAANSGERRRQSADNARRVAHRALRGLPVHDPAVREARSLCAGLVGADATAALGVRLLAPEVCLALEPRHREKVGALIERAVREGSYDHRRGRLSGTDLDLGTVAALVPALGMEGRRAVVVAAAALADRGVDYSQSAWRACVACEIAGHLDRAEAIALADALARAIVRRNAYGVANAIRRASARLPAAFAETLRARVAAHDDPDARGHGLAAEVLNSLDP